MGVPKFFRYISERYPCLSELAREQYIPEFDNLYLDMNGIIHNCSHPDDTNIHFSITEEQIFKDIFNYIDKLFFLIKPRKLFFMAVDGVAPRAKMNQQRARRFRSAKEAEILEKKALSSGVVRLTERFDSNCITPGTEFMARLHDALRYFIKSKISSDPLWQKCRTILTGHDSPGEGEHKIMNYIRYLKAQKDYNPNTQHCLYGLDADLIILGLCTHELRFVILREEVKFGSKAKRTSVEETRFFLLHLGLMREYLELEFHELKQYPEFNVANLIDDWILMGFLVGNDFIPHLPCLHINTNALPLLYKTYVKVFPTIRGNINERGILNLERLELYFAALSDVEYYIFQEKYADLKYFEAKKSNNGIDEAFDFDASEITNAKATDDDLINLIESDKELLDDSENLSDDDQYIVDEFENYKRNYYMNKLNKDSMNVEHKREQAICYITALQWNLDYYYRGVQSWDWYYPHHYAPFISDLKNFKDHKIVYNLAKPFLPFQQLLAVLPAASKNLLPTAYRDLMSSANSELIEYYPENFQTDLNGKQHEWEAVVLIPFIDEQTLLRAMEACDKNLTPEERKRNCHGPMFQYDYCAESQGEVVGNHSFKTLHHVFCTEKAFWSKDIEISSQNSVCYDLPNAERTKYFRGYPTMKYLKFNLFGELIESMYFQFELKQSRVKVFDYCSRNESMILKPLIRENLDNISYVAEKFLQQTVFIGWPYLIKAKVVGVSNCEQYIEANGVQPMEANQFKLSVMSVNEHLMSRMGIEIEDLSVMIHVRTLNGRSIVCNNQGKIFANDRWSELKTTYPAQAVVSNILEQDTSDNANYASVEDLYSKNSVVFFLGRRYYGCKGIVLDPSLVYEVGRVKVSINVYAEPDFTEANLLQNDLDKEYMNVYEAATKLNVHPRCLARLTGTVLIVPGMKRLKGQLPENLAKFNIGLQLKFCKQQEELSGYAKFIDSKEWRFSKKALILMQEYCTRFTSVIEYLSVSADRLQLIFEEDVFPNAIGEGKIQEIVAWLKEQEYTKAERLPWGSSMLEKEVIEKILRALDVLKRSPMKVIKLQINPNLLLKPDVTSPVLYKSKRPICLFDRIIIVRTTYTVPVGAKGTVIGVYPLKDANTVRLECVKVIQNFFEVLFDDHLPNGNDVHGIAEQRVHKVPESSVLLVDPDNKLDINEIGANAYQIQSSNLNKISNTQQINIDQMTNAVSSLNLTRKVTSNDDFWRPASKTTRIRSSSNEYIPPITPVIQNHIEKDLQSPTPTINVNKSTLIPNENHSKISVDIKTTNSLYSKYTTNDWRNPASTSNQIATQSNKSSCNHTSNNFIGAEDNPVAVPKSLDALNRTQLQGDHTSNVLKNILGVVPITSTNSGVNNNNYSALSGLPARIPSFHKPNKQELPQPPIYWRKNAKSNIAQLHRSDHNAPQQGITPNSLSVKYHSNQVQVPQVIMPINYAYNVQSPANFMPVVYNDGIRVFYQPVPQYRAPVPIHHPMATPYYQIHHPSTSHRNILSASPKQLSISPINYSFNNINEAFIANNMISTHNINPEGLVQANACLQQNFEQRYHQQQQQNNVCSTVFENKNLETNIAYNRKTGNEALNESLTHKNDNPSNQGANSASQLRECVKPKKPPRKPRIAAKFDFLENTHLY